jgi:hypothetical protein
MCVRSIDFRYFDNGDLNDYVNSTTNVLKSLYNMCCPLEQFHVCPQRISSPRLKKLRRLKEVYSKAHLYSQVKSLNFEINLELNRLNSIFVDELFRSNKPADIWKNIKRLTGDSYKNGKNVGDLNKLNESFIFPSASSVQSHQSNSFDSFEYVPIEPQTIQNHLLKLKTNSSTGPDELPAIVLKQCATHLAPTICDIVNASLGGGKIPEGWRDIKITPLPKANTLPVKYRPIANTSVLLKITESCLLNKIRSNLNSAEDPLQFAYKPKRSTLDAVATLIHQINSSLDSGNTVYKCLFLDYSSAFNTIPRESIISTMETREVPKWAIHWLIDYFTNRTQHVQVGSRCSSSMVNNCGVLQGAVLSPFLFACYVDSLRSSECVMLKYADDITLGHPAKSAEQCRIIDENVQNVITWSNSHGLILNRTKCVEMLMHLRKLPFPENINGFTHHAQISDEPLDRVDSIKYLGVLISSDLTWSEHVNNLFTKCRKLTFYIKRLRTYRVPNTVIWRFVDSCVLPLILYCSPVIFPSLLKKDFILLRRLFKMISRVSGIQYSSLCDVVIKRHFIACRRLANNVLSDIQHPLHNSLSASRSQRPLRSNFRLLSARTTSYKNSIIPFLSRFLTDESAEIEILVNNFANV